MRQIDARPPSGRLALGGQRAGNKHCGDLLACTPWMEWGQTDVGSFALRSAVITRFALDVPPTMRRPRARRAARRGYGAIW